MTSDRLLRAAVWAVAGVYAAAFLFLVSRRVPFAGELDYIEGVVLDHVVRLMHGEPIYVEPSLDFISLAYMPGFALASSLLGRVFGPELWVPRLVSAGSMTLLALLVAFVLQRETRNRTLAIAGAGLLLASFGTTGGHFDVARPDSLMLLIAFVGLAILRFTSSSRGAVAAALVLTVAFFTKQHAVWFVFAAMAHLFFNDRSRLVPFGLVAVIGCVGGYFALSAWLGPWFSFFTWDEPSRWSQADRGRIVEYVGYRLLGRYGLLSGAILFALALPVRLWGGRSGLWIWVGLAGVATGLMATLDPHAFSHVMNPTVVTLSVLGPLALHHILQHVEGLPSPRRLAGSCFVWLLLLAQFLPLYYGVRGLIPNPGATAARDALVERIRSYPGRVMVTYHGDYARRAGKGTALQMIAFDDIIRARGNRLLSRDPEFVERMFEPLRSGPDRPVLITDEELAESGDQSNPLWREIAPSYVLLETLDEIGDTLVPIVGSPRSPRYVYVPRERAGEFPQLEAPGGSDAR